VAASVRSPRVSGKSLEWPKISTRWFVVVLLASTFLDAVDTDTSRSIRASAGCVKDGNHDFVLRFNARELFRIHGISPC
jgi:hypothetical protein